MQLHFIAIDFNLKVRYLKVKRMRRGKFLRRQYILRRHHDNVFFGALLVYTFIDVCIKYARFSYLNKDPSAVEIHTRLHAAAAILLHVLLGHIHQRANVNRRVRVVMAVRRGKRRNVRREASKLIALLVLPLGNLLLRVRPHQNTSQSRHSHTSNAKFEGGKVRSLTACTWVLFRVRPHQNTSQRRHSHTSNA